MELSQRQLLAITVFLAAMDIPALFASLYLHQASCERGMQWIILHSSLAKPYSVDSS